jgi:teichuronic acid exporter
MSRATVRKTLPWAIVDASTTAVTAIVGLLILSRLLAPRDFGVVALAQAIVGTVQLFASGGIREAVIRHRPVDVAYQDSAHWLAVMLGVAGFIACCGVAGLFMLQGDEPVLAAVLVVTGLTLVLGGFSTLPEAILASKLRTAALARRTMLAKAIYTVVACGLAFAGWGLWSIVWAGLLQVGVSTLALWAAQARLPKLIVRASHVRQILAFGWAISAEAALWSLTGRAFVMLVGLVHGVQTLGYVNLAMRSTEVFSALLTAVNSRLTLPLLAREQRSLERIREIYVRGTELLNTASAPIFVGLSLTAADWIPLVLGDKWTPAIPLVQAFSLAWAIVFSRMLVGDCIRIAGTPRALLPQALLAGAATVVGVILTAGQTMLTVALAWVAARTFVTAPLAAALLKKHVGLSIYDQARPLVRPLLGCAGMSAAVLAARMLAPWGEQASASALRLIGDVMIGITAYLGAEAYLFRREIAAFRSGLARGQAG